MVATLRSSTSATCSEGSLGLVLEGSLHKVSMGLETGGFSIRLTPETSEDGHQSPATAGGVLNGRTQPTSCVKILL